MELERPDLSQTAPDVIVYIEALEAELQELRQSQTTRSTPSALPPEPDEPPTTLNVITVTRGGLAKRTPRHLYSRQRRGGMGIFDLEAPEDDPPAHLLIADKDQDLLLVTNRARAFRLPVSRLPESPIRDRGQSLLKELPIDEDESLSLIVPHQREGYFVLATKHAHVRQFRYHYFRDDMAPGSILYNVHEFGNPVTGCWTGGKDDLFIATSQGRAIRFPEQKITTMGCLGLRLANDDGVVAIAGVNDKSKVCLLTADGKGTIRLMHSFGANKAPGGGGKAAIRSDQVVGAVPVKKTDDIFAISRLSKIIRFKAEEIPPKEGVVQGVNCMTLRADEVVAMVSSS